VLSNREQERHSLRVIHRLALGRARRRYLTVGTMALVCACQRGDLIGTIVDSGSTAQVDGAVDAGLPVMRFGPPRLIPGLSASFAGDDEDPTFTGDLLELYFMSTRNGTQDIWLSQRASSAAAWGPPSLVAELSSPAQEYAPGVSLDGLNIWFGTDRNPALGGIWRSSRATRADPWSAPSPVAELATGQIDSSPAVDATETLMVFASIRPGSAGIDIYSTSRVSPSAAWGPARPVAGANSPADDFSPFVAQGGLVIFFASTRGGNADLFYSARHSTDEPFPFPVPLVDLNSPAYEADPTLSPDLTYMVFTSSRTGSRALYEAHALR